MHDQGGRTRAATAILVATALTAATALLAAAAVPTGPRATPAHLEDPPAGPAGVAVLAAPPLDPAPTAPPRDPAPAPSPRDPAPASSAQDPAPATPAQDPAPAAPAQDPALPAPPPAASPPAGVPDPILGELAEVMAGSYSSAAQAAADPQNFRDIHLVMVPIWEDRADGPWLYVEQAAATSLDKPYRQRVYQLVRTGPETIESRVYTLPDPALRFAGAADDPGKLAGLAPDALTLRSGCAVVLKKAGPVWTGSTTGKECGSDLRGASYATSEVSLDLGRLESWDRGFDADGKQVWGAEKGPYIFVRE